jgi:hypothetical protein
LADEYISENEFEKVFVAVVTYHQLTEEFIKSLLRNKMLLEKIQMYPEMYSTSLLKDSMFGKYIIELEKGIEFPNKQEFISLCRRLNKYRINLVHKLTYIYEKENIENEYSKVKNIYHDLREIYSKEIHRIQEIFNKIRKNIYLVIRENISQEFYLNLVTEIEYRLNKAERYEYNNLKVLHKYIDLCLNKTS